jgi:hypothetical protein
VRDLEIVLNVGEQYANLWTYIKTPDDPNYNEVAHGWKLRELIDSLGLKSKGEMDTAKMIGKKIRVKVTAETGLDGEYRGRARNLFPLGAGGETTEASTNGSDDDAPLTQEELEGWSVEDLKEEMESQGITIPRGRFSQVKAIAAILAAQENGDETIPDEDAEPEAEVIDQELMADLSTDPDFYAEWSVEDLTAYAQDLKIFDGITGRKTKAKIVEAINDLAGNAESLMNGSGEASGEPDDDYDEWPIDELTDEIATRNEKGAEIAISGRKSKEKLIEALRKDDKVGEPF